MESNENNQQDVPEQTIDSAAQQESISQPLPDEQSQQFDLGGYRVDMNFLSGAPPRQFADFTSGDYSSTGSPAQVNPALAQTTGTIQQMTDRLLQYPMPRLVGQFQRSDNVARDYNFTDQNLPVMCAPMQELAFLYGMEDHVLDIYNQSAMIARDVIYNLQTFVRGQELYRSPTIRAYVQNSIEFLRAFDQVQNSVIPLLTNVPNGLRDALIDLPNIPAFQGVNQLIDHFRREGNFYNIPMNQTQGSYIQTFNSGNRLTAMRNDQAYQTEVRNRLASVWNYTQGDQGWIIKTLRSNRPRQLLLTLNQMLATHSMYLQRFPFRAVRKSLDSGREFHQEFFEQMRTNYGAGIAQLLQRQGMSESSTQAAQLQSFFHNVADSMFNVLQRPFSSPQDLESYRQQLANDKIHFNNIMQGLPSHQPPPRWQEFY